MTAKEENKQLKKMYDKLVDYERTLHEQNQRRIKIGIKCIFIVPLFFLFLLFVTDGASSKIIFLVLWIASLFGIAIYLIGIEYVDYKLQLKMNEIQGNENGDVEGLIDLNEVEKRVDQAVEKLEERIEARGGKSNEEHI